MTVILTNRAHRLRTFVLTHEDYCRTLGACACAITDERTPRRVPKALLLPSGGTSSPLDDAVLSVPEIARAARNGDLSVERVATMTNAPPRTPPGPRELSTREEAPQREATKRKRGGT